MEKFSLRILLDILCNKDLSKKPYTLIGDFKLPFIPTVGWAFYPDFGPLVRKINPVENEIKATIIEPSWREGCEIIFITAIATVNAEQYRLINEVAADQAIKWSRAEDD